MGGTEERERKRKKTTQVFAKLTNFPFKGKDVCVKTWREKNKSKEGKKELLIVDLFIKESLFKIELDNKKIKKKSKNQRK